MTIFDKIVRGESDAYVVWEDEKHIAFLTPYPNTPGFTVVIPKENIGDDVFEIAKKDYEALLAATRTVAKQLKTALGVTRVALVFEGTGVAHVHAKLMPLHGELASQTDVWSKETEFTDTYRGWITTLEGPEMSREKLLAIQQEIREVA